MKRIAVLVEDFYQDLEVWYPILRLREAGCEAVAIGPQKKTYKSKHGYEIPADASVDEVSAEDFDAVVVPGGFAPDYLRRHAKINSFVRDIFKSGKPVAAICHGLWVCVSAGILKGKTATSFFAIKDDVSNAGAKWVDTEVCVDGNLISSRKPEDLPAFMKALFGALEKKVPVRTWTKSKR